MLGVVCCSKSGKCLVAQPHFAASLSWIAAIDQKEDGRSMWVWAGRCYWKDNSGEHSESKLVAASPTPNFWGPGGINSHAKCSSSRHYWLMGIGFWRNKNTCPLHPVYAPWCNWGRCGPVVLVTSGHNSFLDSHSWVACWKHWECKFTFHFWVLYFFLMTCLC